MCKTILSVLVVGLLVWPVRAQPREWSDDFLTVTTYGSASLLAPCSGGPPTKYTVIEALVSDIFNERVLSGDGKLVFTNRDGVLTPAPLPGRVELVLVGWLGVGAGCSGEPPALTTSEPFTSDDICMYAGYTFTHWGLRAPDDPNTWELRGPDGEPGIAGVDDDGDGTTDGTVGVVGVDDDGDGTIDEAADAPETDEKLAARPTTVNGGYGNRDGTGFPAGRDNAPGEAGVDDDGNGTTDDIGETGWPSSDDGDDRVSDGYWFLLDTNIQTSEVIFCDSGHGWPSAFSMRETRDLGDWPVESGNEPGASFYKPETHYSFAFCKSGTCYGAQMWVEADMGNPAETLGPVTNTYHTEAIANQVGFAFVKNANADQFMRYLGVLGNKNFSNRFWIISGAPTMVDFTRGIFGYPSPSADLDNDRDVDVNDFLTFSGCFAGSLVAPAGGCQNTQADLDGDGDVDVNDFLTFSGCFNGSLQRPNAACFPPDLTGCP